MPALRSPKRKNWPTGLYSARVKGRVYYRWLDPRTKKYVGLGSDFDHAKAAATQKNAELLSDPVQRLLDRIERRGKAISMGTAVNAWVGHLRSSQTGRGDDVRGLSEKTLSDYEGYGRRFCAHFGKDEMLAGITLQQVSDYLDTYEGKARARNMARGLLIQLWDFARAKGWVYGENVPEQTLKLDHAVRSHRLDFAQFEAIVQLAEKSPDDAWFGPAARFALYCDQRRSDVSNVPAAAWDGATGVLVFVQEKTRHKVTLTAGPKLRKAVEDCLALDTVADGIIRKPGRRDFVSPDMLTKTFARLRDELIAQRHKAWRRYKTMKGRVDDGRPPWREIRSLGAALAKQAGLDAKGLAGHETAAMEALYQKGHAKTFAATSL